MSDDGELSDDDGQDDTFLAFGDEISLQVLDSTLDDTSNSNIGYVGLSTGTGTLHVQYLRGDARTAPRPPEPAHCQFTAVPPTRAAPSQASTMNELLPQGAPQGVTKSNGSGSQDGARSADRTEGHERANFQRLKGTAIVYGQHISLWHNPSRRVVAFTNTGLDGQGAQHDATEDHEDILNSTKVVLTQSGADPELMSEIMQIMPGFKVRSEGERVRYGDVVLLQRVDGAATSTITSIYARPMGASGAGAQPSVHVEVENDQPVVGSETESSRLRVVPIATREAFRAPSIVLSRMFDSLLDRRCCDALQITILTVRTR